MHLKKFDVTCLHENPFELHDQNIVEILFKKNQSIGKSIFYITLSYQIEYIYIYIFFYSNSFPNGTTNNMNHILKCLEKSTLFF